MSQNKVDATHLKRLKYRATHRGTREMDFLLGQFAQNAIASLSSEALSLFGELLEEPDPDIAFWILEDIAQPPEKYLGIVKTIRDFHKL